MGGQGAGYWPKDSRLGPAVPLDPRIVGNSHLPIVENILDSGGKRTSARLTKRVRLAQLSVYSKVEPGVVWPNFPRLGRRFRRFGFHS